MNELALFAGAGGGLLASRLLGWNTVCAVEIEEYPRKVLLQRQRDGHLDRFPVWDDICTFDGKQWRGAIDVVSGGFPCQDISAAGAGAGIDGERSGLWFEMLRIIGEVRPAFVFAENSPNLRTRGLGTVIEGLAGLGYDVRWCVLGAWHVCANHRRNRMWILSNTNVSRVRIEQGRSSRAHRKDKTLTVNDSKEDAKKPWYGSWWASEPDVGRVANGVANRVDRIKAIGNGQVPQVAALAWNILKGEWK